ncbi:hypothetical protein A2U01_0058650, partial [Trifolium medium]|nr:hypothetical protein [Trifolium medium]
QSRVRVALVSRIVVGSSEFFVRLDVEVSVELGKRIYLTKCVAVGSISPVGGKEGWTWEQMRTASDSWKSVGCCHSEVLSIDEWTQYGERITCKDLFRGTF